MKYKSYTSFINKTEQHFKRINKANLSLHAAAANLNHAGTAKFWKNKTVHDIGCGSWYSDDAYNKKTETYWHPWKCRLLSVLGAKTVIGIDNQPNSFEKSTQNNEFTTFWNTEFPEIAIFQKKYEEILQYAQQDITMAAHKFTPNPNYGLFQDISTTPPDVFINTNFSGDLNYSPTLDTVLSQQNLFNRSVSVLNKRITEMVEWKLPEKGFYLLDQTLYQKKRGVLHQTKRQT